MVSNLDIINGINLIESMIYIIPIALNYSYFTQTGIKDYLYVSLFFGMIFLTDQLNPIFYIFNFRNNYFTYQFQMLTFFIGQFFVLSIAIRNRWENVPIWAIYVRNAIPIIGVILQIIPSSTVVDGYWIGQYVFNPVNILSATFAMYCFATTPVFESKNSKAKISKLIWVTFFVERIIQESFYYYLVLNYALDEFPEKELLIIVSLNTFGAAILLLLHILFPEAVLLSKEQIIHASRVYKLVEVKPHQIGMDLINKYLKVGKALLNEEEA